MVTRSRFAVIVHADVIDSTVLVQRDERIAHDRIRDAFRLLSETVETYGGTAHEVRGDALVAEFVQPSAAVAAALAFQAANTKNNETIDDEIVPRVRVGLALGEVVIADGTITGAGVVLAQRLEQLAEDGGVVVQGAVVEALPSRLPFERRFLGEKALKGFSEPVRAFAVSLPEGGKAPVPEPFAEASQPSSDTVPPDQGAQFKDLSPADRPTLAVLPFKNLSDDPDQAYFADGLTEDIITMLAQIDQIAVASRNSAFTAQKQTDNVAEAATLLGVRYVLSGSMRQAGRRVRLAVQLTDTATDTDLWATRFDRDLEHIFAVQDEITLTIATALQIRLTEGEQAALRYTTTENIEAWTAFVQGLGQFRTVSQESYRKARRHFEEALKHDSNSAQILAMLACTHAIEARFYWTADRDASLAAAKTHADAALALDPENADGWAALGYWHMCRLELDDSTAAYARAAEIAPDHADLHALYALALTFAERPDEAVSAAERAMALSPHDPGWYCGVLGHAYRYAGRYDDAIAILAEYNKRSPGFGLVDLVLTQAEMGDMDAARTSAAALLENRPGFTIEGWALTQNCADPARLDADRALLAAAGLP